MKKEPKELEFDWDEYKKMMPIANKVVVTPKEDNVYGHDAIAAFHAHLGPLNGDMEDRYEHDALRLLDLMARESLPDSLSHALQYGEAHCESRAQHGKAREIKRLQWDELLCGFQCNALGLSQMLFHMVRFYLDGYTGEANMTKDEVKSFKDKYEYMYGKGK